MSDSLEFRLLRYILAVAETANFTRAAKRLHLAQPSLSKQIRDLEGEIQFQIFERTRNGVRVTPAGEMVLAYARETLRSREELLAMARAVHLRQVPPLRVGFSAFVDSGLLRGFRKDFCSMFPKCEIRLLSGEPAQILLKIQQRALDCAVLLMPIESDLFQVQQIASSPIMVCMRSDDPLTSESHLDVRTIASRFTIFPDAQANPAVHTRLVRLFSELTLPLNVICSASTPSDIQWMVKASYGLSLVDQMKTLEDGLTTRPLLGADWTVDTAFVHRVRSDHIALPFLERFFGEKWRLGRPKRPSESVHPEQMRLLA